MAAERSIMLHLIAMIIAKPGQRATVLKEFAAIAPSVHAEAGCIEYAATVDASGLDDIQSPLGDDAFIVVEKWESPAALRAHIATPHTVAYNEKTKDLLASRKLHVMSPA